MTRGNLCLGLVAFAGLLALVGLAGCGMVQGSAGTVAAPAVKATGMVHGGQNPVSDATIQLYAVGTTGYGSAATPRSGGC